MPIEINEFKLPITPEEARSFLQKETDSFGVFFDVDRCYELSAIMLLDNKDLIIKAKRLCNNANLTFKDKNGMIQQFKKMGVDSIEFLNPKKRREEILTANVRKAIIENPAYSDDVKELAAMHDKYTSNMRNAGFLQNCALLPNSKALSKLNHRMSVGHPKWSILNTSRIAASDPGVQGIPRSTPEILCEPAGYTLVRADSAQIEPKINFSTFLHDELIVNLITYYDDAYYGILHFCTMSSDEEKACREDFNANFKPIEITDNIKDKRQTIKRLTNAGSYGSGNLGNIDQGLSKAFEMRIVKHPARLALERKVTQDVAKGIDTFYGIFGTPVIPGETERYKMNEDGWTDHVIRCGINNPVQTTASELMMFSVNKAREILSRAKDSHVCFYKHDEACFYVSDEDMTNGIGDELADVTAYNVKGWIPIGSDPLIGVKKGDFPSYIL